MRTRPHPARAAFAAALLALAGCGGGPARQAVDLSNFGFVPATLAVRPGSKVVFVNHDAVPHTATAVDGSWDTGNIAAGDSVVVTVAKPGAYKCSYHPTMTGKLTAE
jgi:plastocyanin